MIASASPCRRDVDDVRNVRDHERGKKSETSESFNPDILHVLLGDSGSAHAPSIFSESLGRTSGRRASSSFPQFQQLPAELRHLIWEAAVPDATVVPRTWGTFRYSLQRKVPAVLQACSESRRHLIDQSRESRRRAAPPKYQLVQGCGDESHGVYVDWRADSVWIYRGYDINAAEIEAYAGLESLVMNWGLRPCWVESSLSRGVSFIRQFPRLRLLTLLVDFSEHGWPEPSTMKGLKRLKRTEVKRIWALVQRSFKEAQESEPQWSPPELHIVHRTANWSRREAR